MTAKACPDLFEKGIDLFNTGRFFECHEVWEEIWKRSAAPEKLFYQGMIQAAAALLHVERCNLHGAASLYAKACAKLDPLPAEHMGIALGELRDAMKEFFRLVRENAKMPDPPKLRRLG